MPEKKNTIGRFEILEKIGEGPIGAVYKALDPVIRRTVAIKVIKLYALEETATFADVFEKIYRVVRTSTSLNHPNICVIYDLSEEKKIPFVTMEFVEGQDLDAMLSKKHQFKRGELLGVLQQMCEAIDFAHKKGVNHQDLKSTNILLTPDLQVKITDFGIAGLDEIAAAQTKKLLSIPYYISPEQALGEKVSPASDLFSLGVIMYQLLSGQLPFPGTSAANVIMMIARDNPTTPRDLEKSGIKKERWEGFFNKALAKAVDQRFKSAREMYEGVVAIIPDGEKNYYPYTFSGASESTGRFEKTFVSETPTVLIDPAKMLDESDEPAAAKVELADDVSETITTIPKGVEMEKPPKREEPPAAATVLVNSNDLKQQLEQRMAGVAPPAPPKPPERPPERQPEPVSAPTKLIEVPAELLKAPQPPPASATLPPKAAAATLIADISKTMPPIPTPPSSSATIRLSPPPPLPPAEPPRKNPPTPPPAPVAPAPKPPAAMVPPPIPQPTTPKMPAASPAATAPKQPKPVAPNMQRYLYLAVIVAILIALIGGGIFFLRKHGPTPPVVANNPAQPAPKPAPNPQPKPTQPEIVLAPTSGKINISTDPPGATVFLGDEQKGVTPYEIPNLPLGKYVIKLQLKGYQDVQQEIELTADRPNTDLPLTLEKAAPQVGTLTIDSTPQGASITIGKKVIGVTPKTLTNRNAGKYTVLLKKEGYEDYSETVRVTADKTTTLSASMKEIPKVVVAPPPPPPKAVEPEVKPGMLVTLGPDVVPPKPLHKTFAKYPEAARSRKIEGVVGLSLLVSETGAVTDVKVVKSANPILDDAAVKAVREWTFEPATKQGVKVKVWLPVQLSFQQSH